MDRKEFEGHLSQINTRWSLLKQANQATPTGARTAQEEILDKYGGAVRRYLLGALRNPDAADDLFQEFACRFLHGDLRGANPERGRFRDFLKGVLSHLIADFHKRRNKQPGPLPTDLPDIVESEPAGDLDQAFLESWRDELLARAWQALAEIERTTGQPWYSVLRFRADHPELRSVEMADQLGGQLDRPLTAVAVRQLLHRAREKFGEFLLEDVRVSLENPTEEQLQEELKDLGLLDYCLPSRKRNRI
jgi:RNA polymerase sigma factor (sigma-70 family)